MTLEPKQEKWKCQNKDCKETESELYWDRELKIWICRSCKDKKD